MAVPLPVLILAGPTGSGKTELALRVARRCGAEIVSADSRQLYRGFSIGTAKPRGRWEETPAGPRFVVDGVVHHLVDVLDPLEPYTAGRFAREAAAVLRERATRRQPTLVVGGTGLYLRALTRGLAPLPEADPTLRATLKTLAEEKGRLHLHGLLATVDPGAAAAIPPNNLQRVMRALEIHRLTGRPLSEWFQKTAPAFPGPYKKFLLEWPAEVLEDRWRRRGHEMMEGLLSETQRALSAGVPLEAPAFQSLGYREAAAFLEGRLSRPAFEEAFFRQTRAYVKRQKTWFRGESGYEVLAASLPWDPDRLADDLWRRWSVP